MANKILITGVTGFIGQHLAAHLLLSEFLVRGAVLASNVSTEIDPRIELAIVEPLGAGASWLKTMESVDTVVHLAGHVHVTNTRDANDIDSFRRINALGTAQLARQAALAGVRRFIFMSTIGVNGDNSGSEAYTEENKPNPHNPYSISKYEAEELLQKISTETGMEIVIIRAPLVYGPRCPGNFSQLIHWISKGYPLPVVSINPYRSFIYIDNLVDVLEICIRHPAAAGKTYLVSDGDDISFAELVREIAVNLDVPPRLFLFPTFLIAICGLLTGKTKTLDRLSSSLVVNISRIRQELGWEPAVKFKEGIRKTVRCYG